MILAVLLSQVTCNGTRLDQAVMSDNGYVILGLFLDSEVGAKAGGETLDAKNEAQYAAQCEERKGRGYDSGMTDIFRKVAVISPLLTRAESGAVCAARDLTPAQLQARRRELMEGGVRPEAMEAAKKKQTAELQRIRLQKLRHQQLTGASATFVHQQRTNQYLLLCNSFASLQLRNSLQLTGEIECATEGGPCACTGLVKFGHEATNRWSPYKEMTGVVQCTNDVFGDSAPGAGKVCMCKDPSTQTQVKPRTFRADGQVCYKSMSRGGTKYIADDEGLEIWSSTGERNTVGLWAASAPWRVFVRKCI